MAKYTTGEIAKLCGVTVRTVQYYDTRGILKPSELSEGGRRLYSEKDLKRMKIICFLRELDIPINNIGALFSEEHPEDVVALIIQQQEELLRGELRERQTRLEKLGELRRALRSREGFSVELIGDVAYIVENKKRMKRLHAILLLTGIPLNVLQWVSIFLWIFTGFWQLFAAYFLIAVPYSVWVSSYYFRHVAYICPQCHEIFTPELKEAVWASHTPTARKLTCRSCGYKGYCVETYRRDTDAQKENGK